MWRYASILHLTNLHLH